MLRVLKSLVLTAVFFGAALSVFAQQAAPQSSAKPPEADASTSKVPSTEHVTPPESPEKHAWRLLRADASDHSESKRQAAVVALSTLGPSPTAVRLVQNALLHDKETDIRQGAASGLAEMKARSALPALRQALTDKSAVVRFAAAKALWSMGDHSGRDVLLEVLQGESSPSEGFIKSSFDDADKKLHNPRALALMGLNEASGAFLGPFSMGVKVAEQLAKDSTAPARALSANLLATDHDPRSVRDLDYALDDKNWAVRGAAAKALGNYRCKALIGDLEPLLDDKKDEVKLMAAAAILKISRSRPSKIPSECSLLTPEKTANRAVQQAVDRKSADIQAAPQ